MNRTLALIAAGLVVLGVGAWTVRAVAESKSAATVTVSDSEVQVLRERTAAYWAARMSGDDRTQWELLEPRGRGRMTPQEYASGRQGVRYLGYQVEDALIEGYFAVVKVRLLVQPILPTLASVPPQSILMDDQWIRVGGAWYRQIDSSSPRSGER